MKINTLSDLRRYEQNHHLADTFKMLTVGVLVLSMAVFAVIGKENVKPIILYWAGVMVVLLLVNAGLDIKARLKDKEIQQCPH